jgi:hypothetical protein
LLADDAAPVLQAERADLGLDLGDVPAAPHQEEPHVRPLARQQPEDAYQKGVVLLGVEAADVPDHVVVRGEPHPSAGLGSVGEPRVAREVEPVVQDGEARVLLPLRSVEVEGGHLRVRERRRRMPPDHATRHGLVEHADRRTSGRRARARCHVPVGDTTGDPGARRDREDDSAEVVHVAVDDVERALSGEDAAQVTRVRRRVRDARAGDDPRSARQDLIVVGGRSRGVDEEVHPDLRGIVVAQQVHEPGLDAAARHAPGDVKDVQHLVLDRRAAACDSAAITPCTDTS